MKLRNKLLISMGLCGLTFLLITCTVSYFILRQHLPELKTTQFFIISIMILCFIFLLSILSLLHILVIKRIEQLNNSLKEINNKKETLKYISLYGNDEISLIALQINTVLNSIEASQNKLEYRVKERTDELQNTNIQLQKEIVEHKTVQKDLMIHKEHLVRLAHYDSLTALPNRVFFNEMLNKTIKHAKRHKKKFALLFIDLNRFKTINDALGHAQGDLVLKEIAERFSSILRTGDILARLGGDEFVVLLTDIGQPKLASPVAEKILQLCAQPIKINEHEFIITTSIGICIFPEDGKSLQDLLKNADMAMFKAKRTKGSVFEYFTKQMNLEAHEHIKLEVELRNAINNNEFLLYYQPKLNLKDGSINGVEALIRWENPNLGLVNPAKFIPIAEATGLIIQIGEWVLREACRANKSWQNQGYQPINIAVNLSPIQLQHQDFAQMVRSILAETQLDPHYLELEITESAVMKNMDTAITRLHDIKKMGVQISIDDFGTGYTSISYLKQFPVSTLKIDQSFIQEIPDNKDDISITRAIIALAHSLNIKVVAEGVETPEQLEQLADDGCDMVQGYYLCRPLPESKILLQLTNLNLPIDKHSTSNTLIT